MNKEKWMQWLKYIAAGCWGIILGFGIDWAINVAYANTPCDYDHKIDSEFTKTIQSTKNVKRKVYPYIEDARKCVMSMDIKIDNTWYSTNGMFTFSPDMSENQACKNAEQRAKEKIIRKISPEVLTSKTDMVCKQENIEVVKKVEKPKIIQNKVPEIGTVISSENIVYSQPQVIYVQPRVIQNEPIFPSWVPPKNNRKVSINFNIDLLGLLNN